MVISKKLISLFFFLFFLACQDELFDPSVSKSVENDFFRLTMDLSDDIVKKDGNIKIDVSLERKINSPYLLPGKVLGEWYLREVDSLELKEDSISVIYEFWADSTFSLSKTFSFSEIALGSQVLGQWAVYSDTDYNLHHGYDTTTTDVQQVASWTEGDSTYTVNSHDIIHVDSVRNAIEYSFANDYGFTINDEIHYNIMTVTETDTMIDWNNGDAHWITQDTTFSEETAVTERKGLWEFVQESVQTITLRYYDVPGGETYNFTTTFDLDQATIPTGGFMYWSGENSRSVVLQKTGSTSTFYAPDDSTASFGGGWLFAENGDAFTVTTILNNATETATVTFDAPGSTVPVGGLMFWTTGAGVNYVFEKKANPSSYDPNFENIDMNIIVSAVGGDIFKLNSTSGSEYQTFEVLIGHGENDKFSSTCFFDPVSSAGSNGYISAQFNDLTLTIVIYIITG